MAELRDLQALRKARGGVAGTGKGDGVAPTESLLGAIAALEETPDGVTTSLPEAESSSCETKPISREVSSGEGVEEVGRGSPTHEEGQTCETKPICRASCETKPICVVSFEEQRLCDKGFTSDPALSGLGETKPIPVGANRSKTGYRPILRRRRSKQFCETKPICEAQSDARDPESAARWESHQQYGHQAQSLCILS